MFEGFARQWTPLLPVGRVRSTPQRVRVAGTDLVTWRTPDGEVGVLLDRCPHRSTSLALGSVREDGSLACGFHGWEFGPDGSCRHIPFNPAVPRGRCAALALPVAVAGGYVWVFTGFDVSDAASLGPSYDPALDLSSDIARMDHVEEWDCHWTRALENMLDFPHLPYVHRTTIGRFVRRRQHRDSTLGYDLIDTPYGFRFGPRLDGDAPRTFLSWYRPHGMTLDTLPAPRMMRILVWCVPVGDTKTRMILSTVRDLQTHPALSPAFDALNRCILHQDRAIVESSDPPSVPHGGAERSVPTDRPS
ncbi:MAG: aromatic ring-hydroxylating dioxygenase subunit alpha [Dermatophilaceae bacterium]